MSNRKPHFRPSRRRLEDALDLSLFEEGSVPYKSIVHDQVASLTLDEPSEPARTWIPRGPHIQVIAKQCGIRGSSIRSETLGRGYARSSQLIC